MPTIARLPGANIRIYADDHAPPHFHLVGPRSDAQVRLDTLEVLRGVADRRDLEEARAWSMANPGVLRKEWERLNERG